MNYSLLRMTQLLLSSMDSDEVNSIGDTTESRQVVDIIETTFNDIVTDVSFPEHFDLFELEPSNDPTRPTLMYVPSKVRKIEWIQYDNRLSGETIRNMQPVSPLMRYEFFARTQGLDSADADVYQYNYLVGAETFDVRGKSDRFPQYFTNINNRVLLFDSYRSDEDTTLTANKTVCFGQIIPTFTRSDGFVPDLDPQRFSYLFNEAKLQAHAELKQVENAIAARRARTAKVRLQNQKHPTEQPGYKTRPDLPNYGRKRFYVGS